MMSCDQLQQLTDSSSVEPRATAVASGRGLRTRRAYTDISPVPSNTRALIALEYRASLLRTSVNSAQDVVTVAAAVTLTTHDSSSYRASTDAVTPKIKIVSFRTNPALV